jgi:hypothetical protein
MTEQTLNVPIEIEYKKEENDSSCFYKFLFTQGVVDDAKLMRALPLDFQPTDLNSDPLEVPTLSIDSKNMNAFLTNLLPLFEEFGILPDIRTLNEKVELYEETIFNNEAKIEKLEGDRKTIKLETKLELTIEEKEALQKEIMDLKLKYNAN